MCGIKQIFYTRCQEETAHISTEVSRVCEMPRMAFSAKNQTSYSIRKIFLLFYVKKYKLKWKGSLLVAKQLQWKHV